MLEQQPSLPLPTSRDLWLCPETRLRLPTGHLVPCAQEAMVRVTPPEHSTKAEPPPPQKKEVDFPWPCCGVWLPTSSPGPELPHL